ncbi:MAG: hypothetical protein ACH346_00415 [Chthoniobacterales bacterium]
MICSVYQNDFSTGSRTFQVCFAILKIIFRLSLYINFLAPITVFRLNNQKNINLTIDGDRQYQLSNGLSLEIHKS